MHILPTISEKGVTLNVYNSQNSFVKKVKLNELEETAFHNFRNNQIKEFQEYCRKLADA